MSSFILKNAIIEDEKQGKRIDIGVKSLVA